MKTLKNLFNPNKLSTLLFYLSILLFIIAFNFAHNPPSGWYQQFLPNLNGAPITDITFIDSLVGYAVTNYQAVNDTDYILKTMNGGDNWNIIRVDSKEFVGFNKIIFLNKDTGFVTGVNGPEKTTNGGLNWLPLNNPVPALVYNDMSVINEDTLWMAASSNPTGGVFRTTNGGVSWQQQLSLGSQNPDKIYMFNSRIGFTATGAGLYKTTNSGMNWLSVSGGYFIDIYFSDSLTGWKNNGVATIFQKTTNGGLNWVTYNLPPEQGNILISRIVRFNNIGKDTIWSVGSTGTTASGNRGLIYKTTNSGINWGYQLPDPININIFAYQRIKFTTPLIGWAYTGNKGIHTITGGDTTYFVGIKQIPNYIPEMFILSQNYPNPFNPTTSIPFELKESSYVTLRVYDVRGVMIKELVNGGWSASKYISEFDARLHGTNLSSGIYFYKIEITGDNTKEKFTETKRMTLIK